jgi:hypothetical protein
MHRQQQIVRLAGTVLALLTALLAAMVCGWAYADTPIVILDGSLTIQSAVPWNQFTGTGDVRTHPDTTKSVTAVTVTMPGKNQAVKFSGEVCAVDITYAGAHIMFTTGNTGKGLRVSPFSAFAPGATPNHLAHRNQNVKISHVTVSRAGVKVFDSDASGGTKVVIDYQ